MLKYKKIYNKRVTVYKSKPKFEKSLRLSSCLISLNSLRRWIIKLWLPIISFPAPFPQFSFIFCLQNHCVNYLLCKQMNIVTSAIVCHGALHFFFSVTHWVHKTKNISKKKAFINFNVIPFAVFYNSYN